MKVSISKDSLLNALQAVQNVISSRSTLPVLSNVLLRAVDGRLQLTATDLDLTLSCSVEASVIDLGATTLPLKKFSSIVKELLPQPVELSVDEKNICEIVCGSSYYKMHGVAAEEFPPQTPLTENRKVVLQQDKLKLLLRRTMFASSNDESRFVLNGLFLSLRDHTVTVVATDGRRLALADQQAEVPAESCGECIIPSKAVNELVKLLQPQGDVLIRFSDNQAAFGFDTAGGMNVVLTTKLIDGSYPNYKQVIPVETRERISLPREELLAALRRAEVMTSDKSNSVKMTFSRNTLSITANTPDVGEGRETMAVNYKGPDLSIAFNPAYLMEPLKALESEEVYLELIDDLSPGLLKTTGQFLYVLMPMRMT